MDLVTAASGRPFVSLRGGTARVTAVDGEERLGYVQATSAHLRLDAFTSLAESTLYARGPIAFGGVFTPSAKTPLSLQRIDEGHVLVSAPLTPPSQRASIEQQLGCDQLSLEQENFDHAGPPLPAQAPKVTLKPERAVGFATEPGGPSIVEVKVGAQPLPPGVDDFLQVEERRGARSLVRWGLATGMLRGWVASSDLGAAVHGDARAPTAIFAPPSQPQAPRQRLDTLSAHAYAICDTDIPLIVQTDDELVLAGQVRPGTCIDVLSSHDDHARVSLRIPEASFGAHVSLFTRQSDLASCRLVQVSSTTTPGDLPVACADGDALR